MVVIDTDVLLLSFAFQNDQRQPANAQFMSQVQSVSPATTIYNVMELLGQLSFNLAPTKLDAWQTWLVDAYQLTVIWPIETGEQLTTTSFFRSEIVERPFARMRAHRIAFMDSLILNLAERIYDVEAFVTWNAKHFKGKSTLTVLTPEEYLQKAV